MIPQLWCNTYTPQSYVFTCWLHGNDCTLGALATNLSTTLCALRKWVRDCRLSMWRHEKAIADVFAAARWIR